MGQFLGLRNGATLEGVDPKIIDIVKNAIAAIPYDAKITSGERPKGKTALGNHDRGYAIDVQLYTSDGKALPNRGTAAYAAYEQYAQAARVYQTQAYPGLPLRTGLGFATKRGGKTLDPMHLDITPGRNMPLYSWDTGGKGSYSKFSNGGLSGPHGEKLVADYSKAIAAGAPTDALSAIAKATGEGATQKRATALAYAAGTGPEVAPKPMPGRPTALQAATHLDANGAAVAVAPEVAHATGSAALRAAQPQSIRAITVNPDGSPATPGLNALAPLAMNGVAPSAVRHRVGDMTPGQDYGANTESLVGSNLSLPARDAGADPKGSGPDWTVLKTLMGSGGFTGAHAAATAGHAPFDGATASVNGEGASAAAPVPMPSPSFARETAARVAAKIEPADAAAPPKLLRLPSGKLVAPGVHSGADGGSFEVTDGGNGKAIVTKILAPGTIPGVFNPLTEGTHDTILGGIVNRGKAEAQKKLEEAAKSVDVGAVGAGLKSAAVDAAQNLGGNAFLAPIQSSAASIDAATGGNVSSFFGGLKNGLTNLFSKPSEATKPTSQPWVPASVMAPTHAAAAPKVQTSSAWTSWNAARSALLGQEVNPTAVSKLQDIHDLRDSATMAAQAGPSAAAQRMQALARLMAAEPSRYVSAGGASVATGFAPEPAAPKVQVGSGRVVPVGSSGSSQGGIFNYEVQSDGSIKNLTNGRMTPAPVIAPPAAQGQPVGSSYLAAQGADTSGMAAGQVQNELMKAIGGHQQGSFGAGNV